MPRSAAIARRLSPSFCWARILSPRTACFSLPRFCTNRQAIKLRNQRLAGIGIVDQLCAGAKLRDIWPDRQVDGFACGRWRLPPRIR